LNEQPLQPLDYQSTTTKTASSGKWRAFLNSLPLAVASLILFATGPIVLLGRVLASDLLSETTFIAAMFSIVVIAIGFPILVAIGFILRPAIEKSLGRQFSHRRFVPWLVPVFAAVICILASLFQDRSTRTLFHNRLNLAPPASLSNFKYWWATLPGDSLFAFSFSANPADFDKLLTNHTYVLDTDPQDIQNELRSNVPPNFVGSDLQLPSNPIVAVYKYSMEDGTGLPHIVDVFTTQKQDEVVIGGDN
jgi:hypothetical protein